MYHDDLRSKLGEVESLGNSGVPTTYNDYWLFFEEGGITGSTVRYPFTSEFFFSRYTQFASFRTAGYNHSFGGKVAFGGLYHFLSLLKLDASNLSE